MRFIILGIIIMGIAAGGFYFLMTADLQLAPGFTREEVNSRVGQVAGGLGGLGAVIFLVGVVRRLRGR